MDLIRNLRGTHPKDKDLQDTERLVLPKVVRCTWRDSSHREELQSIAVNFDGSLIALGYWDGVIRLWNLQEKSRQEVSIRKAHEVTLAWSLQLLDNGTKILAGCTDKTLRGWAVNNISDPVFICKLDENIVSMRQSADGKKVVCRGERTVRVWDTKSLFASLDDSFLLSPIDEPKSVVTLPEPQFTHLMPTRCVALSDDGALLATCSNDGVVVNVLEMPENRPISRVTVGGVVTLSFLSGRRLFVCGTREAFIIECDTHRRLFSYKAKEDIESAAICRDRNLMLVVSRGRILAHDINNRQNVWLIDASVKLRKQAEDRECDSDQLILLKKPDPDKPSTLVMVVSGDEKILVAGDRFRGTVARWTY